MSDSDSCDEQEENDPYETDSDLEVISLNSEDEFDEDKEESFIEYFEEKRNEGLFYSFERGRKN